MAESPKTSVVLVNYRGASDTLGAIEALSELPEYPEHLEIVVVDNASGDDSVAPSQGFTPRLRLWWSLKRTLVLPADATSVSPAQPATLWPF